MLIHTDEKPYQCEECDMSFRQKQLLKRHLNLYHNPQYVAPKPHEKKHKCPTCDRAFRHKGNLIRHMAMHDPDPKLIEESKALKVGRQKRVQTIDGQRVEIYVDEDMDTNVYEGEEDDDDGDGDHLVTTAGEDDEDMDEVYVEDGGEETPQGYIVLEVIPVDDGEKKVEPIGVDETVYDDSDDQTLMPEAKRMRGANSLLSKSKDMANCFGFDVGFGT